MTTWVNVYGGLEGFDVQCLLNASPDPIMFGIKDGYILFAEVVVIVSGMLQHCRLELTKSIRRSGRVLLEAGSCSPFSFANVCAWARCGISSSAWYVVDMTSGLLFVELVFGLNQGFPD